MKPEVMHVLHVIPSFYPARHWGGPVVSVYELCNHLARLQDVHLKVLTTDASGPGRHDRLSRADCKPESFRDYEVFFCRKTFGKTFSLSLLGKLGSMVKAADVIHLTAVYSSTTFPVLMAARFFGKPVVWSPRGALQRWSGTHRRVAKRVWDGCCALLIKKSRTVLHVTSAAEKAESLSRFPGLRAEIISNGVEVPPERSERQWMPNGRMRLGYLGRLDPKKGIENLLEALALLRSEEYSLRIFGDGDSDYVEMLHRMVARLNLGGRVQFCGAVAGEDKSRALQGADAFVVPSHTENFGMVVAEALAHGTPVIASTGTPWREVEMRGAGRWVPNDPASLADAIRTLAHADLAEMGRNGRAWMLAEYGWPRVARQMAELYRSLRTRSMVHE